MKRPKFYAVKKGHKPGIYDKWVDCSNQITRFRKPIFKKCDTKMEAENFMQDEIPKEPTGEKCTICNIIMEISDDNMNCILCNVFCYHSACILAKSNFTVEEEIYFRRTLLCDFCATRSKIDNNKNGKEDSLKRKDKEVIIQTNNPDLDFLLKNMQISEDGLIEGLETTTRPLREGNVTSRSKIPVGGLQEEPLVNDGQMGTDKKRKINDHMDKENEKDFSIKEGNNMILDNLGIYDKILSEIHDIKDKIVEKENVLSFLVKEIEYIKSKLIVGKKDLKVDRWSQTDNKIFKEEGSNTPYQFENKKPHQSIQKKLEIDTPTKKYRPTYFYNSNWSRVEKDENYLFRYYIGKMNTSDTPENLFSDIKNYLMSGKYKLEKDLHIGCYKLKSKIETEAAFCIKSSINSIQLLNGIKKWPSQSYITPFRGPLREQIVDSFHRGIILYTHRNKISSTSLSSIPIKDHNEGEVKIETLTVKHGEANITTGCQEKAGVSKLLNITKPIPRHQEREVNTSTDNKEITIGVVKKKKEGCTTKGNNKGKLIALTDIDMHNLQNSIPEIKTNENINFKITYLDFASSILSDTSMKYFKRNQEVKYHTDKESSFLLSTVNLKKSLVKLPCYQAHENPLGLYRISNIQFPSNRRLNEIHIGPSWLMFYFITNLNFYNLTKMLNCWFLLYQVIFIVFFNINGLMDLILNYIISNHKSPLFIDLLGSLQGSNIEISYDGKAINIKLHLIKGVVITWIIDTFLCQWKKSI